MVPLFLTPGDVARKLGLSVSRVIALDRPDGLVALRDSGNRRLYRPEDVELFAQRRREAKERAVGSAPIANVGMSAA